MHCMTVACESKITTGAQVEVAQYSQYDLIRPKHGAFVLLNSAN